MSTSVNPMTVAAFHGTSKSGAHSILSDGFQPSDNGYDWLGPGVYFFERYPKRARKWAEKHKSPDWAVVVSEVDLTDCLDLDSGEYNELLFQAYNKLNMVAATSALALPRQNSKGHRLDHMVVQYLVRFLETQGITVRSVRRSFIEGDPVFPESAITTDFHTQLCVVDYSMITNTRLFLEA